MLIYNSVKLKQPQRGKCAKEHKPNLTLQTTCLSRDHEMTPREYAAEMLEKNTHRRNKLIEPTKATSPTKINVRLRILIISVMLD